MSGNKQTKKKGDDRFQALLTDAKFRTSSSASKTDSAPKRPIPNNSKPGKAPTAAATGKHKVVVDDRFKSMFEGEEFQSKPVLDRHGRRGAKPTASSSSKDIARHYTLDKVDETRLEKLNQLARGGHNSEDDDSSSGSSSSSSSSGEEDEDEDEQVVFDSDAITKLEMSHDSSHRLACVGCDWDRVRAVDLLAILGSFAPPLGAILRVSIYPTQFGLERMELEDENGPLSATATVLPEEDDEDQGESSNLMGSKYNPELLRKYEKERLLYCVAVIECDSKETAEAVYKECDGLEFEHSSIALDLRFVPNDVKFDSTKLRDSCDEVPDEYQGPEEFVNKSLQQTTVSLSWDDAKHERAKLHEWGDAASQGKRVKKAGVSMNELEAFIASSEDDSEEEEEDRALAVQKYRALLLATPDVATAALEEEEEEQEYVPNVPVKKDRKKPTPVNLAAEPSTSKPKKTKRSAKKQEAEEDEVKLDVGDERLAGLFTEPEFMLDQTDPRYKPTKTTKTINEERRKRIKIRD